MSDAILTPPQTVAEAIQRFMAQKRIAVVGVSREKREYSRRMFRDLLDRGYNLVPVNPSATEIEDLPCFARLADLATVPPAALLLLPKAALPQALEECRVAGVKMVWIPLQGGKGAITDAHASVARDAGMTLIRGFCPYMFMDKTGFLHRLHGYIEKHGRAYQSAV